MLDRSTVLILYGALKLSPTNTIFELGLDNLSSVLDVTKLHELMN